MDVGFHLKKENKMKKPIPYEETLEYKFSADWNVGRNDKCPCGSEKKYKKCCWDIVIEHCAKYYIGKNKI